MANFLRMLLGLALLPACWGAGRVLVDAIMAAAGGAIKAGQQELNDNPRAHSATLRVFEKGWPEL